MPYRTAMERYVDARVAKGERAVNASLGRHGTANRLKQKGGSETPLMFGGNEIERKSQREEQGNKSRDLIIFLSLVASIVVGAVVGWLWLVLSEGCEVWPQAADRDSFCQGFAFFTAMFGAVCGFVIYVVLGGFTVLILELRRNRSA